MQEMIKPQETGVGVRFTLAPGGDVYLQTAGRRRAARRRAGRRLDRAPDHGRHRRRAAGGQVWVLPDDKLVQLLLGLSTLVESTLIVTGHNFKHSRRLY
jgi:hypothetical protein